MTNSEHVMLVGKGALKFAKQQKLEIVDSSYFFTQRRWDYLQKQIRKNKMSKHGTVGCVVLDKFGDLAAGTSTGGISNKQYGRVGDSPIIGAGTYADNNTCAVSATGHGEYFIRYVVAYDISALMKYKNQNLNDAANYVIKDKLVKAGGDGGVIAVDKEGNIAVSYNTKSMFRAYATSNGDEKVDLY
jgi:beta-aspartyl-peptidase (threonine type)